PRTLERLIRQPRSLSQDPTLERALATPEPRDVIGNVACVELSAQRLPSLDGQALETRDRESARARLSQHLGDQRRRTKARPPFREVRSPARLLDLPVEIEHANGRLRAGLDQPGVAEGGREVRQVAKVLRVTVTPE